MFDIQSYQKAESVNDAIRLLGEDPEARLIAGGTDVLIKLREFKGFSRLVDIHGLPELKPIVREADGTVRVAGKDYTIASYDPEAHVQRVAAYVDRKLHELSAATRLPQAQLSVLAALNIADDMLKAHDEITRLRRELMETQQKLEAARK